MRSRKKIQNRIIATKKSASSSRKVKSPPALSPLRYPGSKRRLVSQIEKIIQANGIRPRLFVEPFAGGASVAIQLLQNGTVEKIGLVDLDPLVASFWQTVFFDSKWLVKQVRTIDVTLEQWRKFKKYRGSNVRTQALACLFLNRTSFSGILAAGAGAIGGAGQRSKYPIDCRFSRETLVQRIEQLAAMRDRVAFIWNTSWSEAFRRLEKQKKYRDGTFLYVDPPFFEKADKLYRYYFTEKHHIELRDQLLETKIPWLLSYDAPKTAERLYSNARTIKRIGMNYSAHSEGGFRTAQEILISNLPSLSEKSILGVRPDIKNRTAPKPLVLKKADTKRATVVKIEVRNAKYQSNSPI